MCSAGGDGGSHRRVSPFGYRRLFACTQLPDAFRSVPRPSSALDAQASPVRLLALVSSYGDRTPASCFQLMRTFCLRFFYLLVIAYSVVNVSQDASASCLRECSSLPLGNSSRFRAALASLCPASPARGDFARNRPSMRALARLPVGLTRLELVTFPLSEGCSNRLSYRPGIARSAILGSVLRFAQKRHRPSRRSTGCS